MQKLPQMARRLEESLFRAAVSFVSRGWEERRRPARGTGLSRIVRTTGRRTLRARVARVAHVPFALALWTALVVTRGGGGGGGGDDALRCARASVPRSWSPLRGIERDVFPVMPRRDLRFYGRDVAIPPSRRQILDIVVALASPLCCAQTYAHAPRRRLLTRLPCCCLVLPLLLLPGVRASRPSIATLSRRVRPRRAHHRTSTKTPTR